MIHSSLKLVDDGVEGGVGASCPLEALRDPEPLATDLVQDAGQSGGHLFRENLVR